MLRLVLILLLLAVSTFQLPGQTACSDCTHETNCTGTEFCEDAATQVMNLLWNIQCGDPALNQTILSAAFCLQDLLDNSRVRRCTLPKVALMQTGPDCENRTAAPHTLRWCPGTPANNSSSHRNCVCINDERFDTDCYPVDEIASKPESKLAVLAAALAHESHHALTGEFATTNGGASYEPPCNYLNNEIAAHQLEMNLLTCINALLPQVDPDITARVAFLQVSLNGFQALATAAGC